MLLLLFLLGLTLADSLPTEESELLAQVEGCPDFWFRFNGRCYKYFSTSMTWADAELHCVSQNANLVSIHSLEEQNFVKRLIKNSDPTEGLTWIGLSDLHKEGHWMWSDGSAVKYDFWHTDQPDNYEDSEDCVDTNWGTEKKWNDVSCASSIPFVCVARTS